MTEMYFTRLLDAYSDGENLPSNDNVNAESVARNIVLKHSKRDMKVDMSGPLYEDIRDALIAAEARGAKR